MDERDLSSLVDELTLLEQVSLLSGEDFWSLPAVSRLGLGKLRVTDGPNGARGAGSFYEGVTAAAFPVGIAIGSSWNPELVNEIGVALAAEAKTKHAHVLLGPTINLHRSVTNGRNFECFSEDPELTAALAVAYIQGLQDNGVAATPKHFAANESEIQRTTMSSVVDERTLRELYLRPFEASVREGGAWAIMSSYNRLNGIYTSEHPWLLSKVLREEWGFDGVVMSDWFGSHSAAPTVNAGLDLEMPGPSRDRGENLLAAVNRNEVSRETVREHALNVLRLMARTGALRDLRPLEEQSVDRAETRALIRRAGAEGMVLLKNDGLLPLDPKDGAIAVIGPNAKTAQIMGGGSSQFAPQHRVSPWEGLAERAGEKALIHVQGCSNHRWEPLWAGEIAVEYFANQRLDGAPVHIDKVYLSQILWMPPFAEGKVDPLKFSARLSWNYVPDTDGLHRFGLHSAGLAKLFVDGELVANAHDGWTRGRTVFEEGCDEIVGEADLVAGRHYAVTVEFVSKPGYMFNISAVRAGVGRPLGEADIAAAAEAAGKAKSALVFVGRSGEWDTEGSDLESIELPGRQNDLVAAVLAANPNTVVVLQTGGPVEMPWAGDARSILQAWYPGQEAGHAIADVLFGFTEPSGRLPQTFPKRWRDNPSWSQDPRVYPGLDGEVAYSEGIFIGYRHYEKHGFEPLFPFGHGLGYTEFKMGKLVAEIAGDGARVKVPVENTGARTGATVVQIYVGDREASVPRPVRELRAFRKVSLETGERAELTFELTARAFSFFDTSSECWRVEAGEFEISAGFSIADIRVRASLTLPELKIPK